MSQSPRYIDRSKCTGCGACAQACPLRAANDYNCGLDHRAAAYIPYTQAVPMVYAIDPNTCIGCGLCEKVCLAGAVLYADTLRITELEVGAVVLAAGSGVFDPSCLDSYHYANHPNVVSSLEFERILSASGPYRGHLMRPYDREEPRKIAWLQCVGSRDLNHCDNSYCSGVCCMYAIKEAVIAKEHAHGGLDTAIFFMDMRTYGKDFEKYYLRAKREGVRFIRSRVHTVKPVGDGDLEISYVGEEGRMHTDVYNLVVLSVGLDAGEQSVDLARRLGIDLNQNRFVNTDCFTPVSTSRPGVFACGTIQGPKDIPQSIMEASAAACACSASLSETRWSVARVKEKHPEKDVSDEPPRVGVFVCRCGTNIGGIVDVPEVREYARSLPNVVYVEDNLYTCSQDNQVKMAQVIKEQGINRVVVAACTPRTHEPLFQETLMNAGLNKYLFEMANIRNQNSWCHSNAKAVATPKAKDLVRMAVARAALLDPLFERPLDIVQSGLVIGGGVAGMTAALGLARQGFEVALIEKEKELGGLSRRIAHTIEGKDVQEFIACLIEEVKTHRKIEVMTDTRITGFSGYKGNFFTQVQTCESSIREISHGCAILATGAREDQPKAFGYGANGGVMTQLELDELMRNEPARAAAWDRVVMIQCVGSRTDDNPNCSRVCCQSAVKHARELKKLNPHMDVMILYRDMMMYGLLENYYALARTERILFSRYDLENPPQVNINGAGLSVVFTDHVLNHPVEMRADAVILSAVTLAAENGELASMLKIQSSPDGYFIEAHAKLRPVDFASEGLYMCGMAHSPKLITESISQALAAASRAGAFLAARDQTVGGVVAKVDPKLCATCMVCVRSCPYGVPQIVDYVSEINEALCRGCGTCVSECPAKAIHLANYTDNQIMIKVEALLEDVM
ncbi:MAG: FAD-dependent oxidoreductase [Syntrophobacteraceae bacterium]